MAPRKTTTTGVRTPRAPRKSTTAAVDEEFKMPDRTLPESCDEFDLCWPEFVSMISKNKPLEIDLVFMFMDQSTNVIFENLNIEVVEKTDVEDYSFLEVVNLRTTIRRLANAASREAYDYLITRKYFMIRPTWERVQNIRNLANSVGPHRERFEYCVLFEMFPKYCDRYNVPALTSDIPSVKSLGPFLDFLNDIEKTCKLTLINKRLSDCFNVNYVDQAIIKLAGDVPTSPDIFIGLYDVEQYTKHLHKTLKLTKKQITPHRIHELIKYSHSMGKSIVNTILLVMLKACEKTGNKTNFFSKCARL